MNIEAVVTIMQNRVATLKATRDAAVASGSLEAVNSLDAQIVESEATVAQLQTLVPAPIPGE